MVFKIDMFFVPLNLEVPNKSVLEIEESLPIKIFSPMLRILQRKTDFSSKNYGHKGYNEQ